jgi:hypothetical protein
MNFLSVKATQIFLRLLHLARSNDKEELYVKIHNNTSFMPLSVECIDVFESQNAEIWSVCHYGEQNGDLMNDLEMTFWVHEENDKTFIFPMSFRNDYMNVYQECMWQDFNEVGKFNVKKRLQRQLVDFAQTWLKNIEQQQGI